MLEVRFIAELGSVHMGKLDPIKQAIDLCALYKIDALKLQLFPDEAPYTDKNIYLPFKLFEQAFEYALKAEVDLSASVFGKKELEFLLQFPVKWVKLAYSQKEKHKWIEAVLMHGKEAIVSGDVLSESSIPPLCTKLLCHPFYPVPFIVDFKEMFPRFDGYSDHTIGLHQTEVAIESGAKIIEKHVRLGSPSEMCPDAQFAVNLKRFGEFVRKRRSHVSHS